MNSLETAISAIETAVCRDNLIAIVLSNPWPDQDPSWQKVHVRPINLRGKVVRQWEYHTQGKVFHHNRNNAESATEMRNLLTNNFRQAQVYAADTDTQVVINDKRQARILTRP